MRSSPPFRLSALAPALAIVGLGLALGCGGSGGGGTDAGGGDAGQAALKWYATCGDPVCRGYTGPFPNVPACTSEKIGDTCAASGARCDPKDSCNAQLQCGDRDPRQQPGGCPISRARFKQDVRYLSDAQREALHQQVQRLRLATYRYRDAGPQAPPRLGFLIDDAERGAGGAAAVDAERDMIDLYGYTSMAMAALQVQAQQIAALQDEVARLRAQRARPAQRRDRP